MTSNVIAVLVAASAVYLLISINKVLTNPLNAVPGPWYARFTGAPGTIATLRRRQVQYHHSLHQKYGLYVRVSPNQVLVSDVEAFKAVHKIGSGFRKADSYHYLNITEAGRPPYGLFQMTKTEDHARRRKLLGRGLTGSSLRTEWESMVREKVTAAVEGMARDASRSNGQVDVRKWWVLMASDVVSHLMFGESFDALKTGETGPWFEAIGVALSAAFFALSFPWTYAVAKRLPLIGALGFFHAHTALMNKGRAAVANSKQSTGSQTANLFAKVLSQAEKGDASLTDEDIAVEAGSFMVAGTDTTSNTLTYLLWAVLSRPGLQAALEDEATGVQDGFTDAHLEKLPVLHAVIEETLRLYGAAPGPLPRIVPAGGVQLGGYHFPEGTDLATQTWTLHRDPENFDNPERFDHTRWMPGGECTTSEAAKAAFSPFGAGSRACIGKHLAYMELRYGVVMFFRRFRGCRLAPTTTPESMEMDNLFLVEPRGKVCNVILSVA